ncbi:uncharacterized protein J3D65DRAFT_984 [Phyllosticta citribraziliensis]|uniref:Uncharacterized protein n=1 Tax=Phyllosticta citribraziliensis TaxID=989973 RepID=A0ABR1M7Y7_9PEZI
MTKNRSSDKHEAPRRKGHERVDAFAKTHMRGLEVMLKSKREMLKQKAARLLHRRHDHGRKTDQLSQTTGQEEAETATVASDPGTREVATRDGPVRASSMASRASRPAANDQEFYRHLDQHPSLNNDDEPRANYEDDLASALQRTRLSGTDVTLAGSSRNLTIDYNYDEQACLDEALEASARELAEREEELRTLKMALRISVEDQGGVRYHTYDAAGNEQGVREDGGGERERAGTVVEYTYNPDEDGESSMMGSLRAGKFPGDDPPPYTPF